MILKAPFRLAARVEMHLPGGFTRVVLFDLDDGHHRIEIPTDRIPVHLRRLGAIFLVVRPQFTPEDSDSAEAVREMCSQLDVEELPLS